MQGVTEVDKVELVIGVDPLLLEVVDEKVDVFGDKGGLDGREVDAGEGGVGVPVADWVCLLAGGLGC